MQTQQLASYWEEYHVLVQLLKELQEKTDYLQQAISSLEKVPSGTPGDIAGQAKADALGKTVISREETNRKLLSVYEKMYRDLSRSLFPGKTEEETEEA